MDAGATSPALLERLGDWSDHDAWSEFVARYERFVRACCQRYRLDASETEELCQRVWIALARRMRTYRYDPTRTFRGWLRRLCESRALDLLRERRAERLMLLDGQAQIEAVDHDDLDREPPRLLRTGEQVQHAVKRRVGERTWRIFWSIDIEGTSVRETATAFDMTYAAAFAARKRVSRMLREEGERFLTGSAGATETNAAARSSAVDR